MSLRIGVHHADAVVWGPVSYRTHLRIARIASSGVIAKSSVSSSEEEEEEEEFDDEDDDGSVPVLRVCRIRRVSFSPVAPVVRPPRVCVFSLAASAASRAAAYRSARALASAAAATTPGAAAARIPGSVAATASRGERSEG